jgi:hypothetical protein
VSELALSGIVELPQSVFRIEVYGGSEVVEFDAVAAAGEEPWTAVREAFVASVRAGKSGDLDVRRGLMLQKVIDRAMGAVR